MRKFAELHIKLCTNLNDIAERMIGVCAKDLICSQAKYHASCLCVLSVFSVLVTLGKFNFLEVMIMNCSQHMIQSIVLRIVDPKFTSYRCSSLPTANFFKRWKKNEAEVIQRCQDYHKNAHQGLCASPTNGSSFVCPNGSAWAVSENRNENLLPAGSLPIPLVYLG